MNKPFDMLNLTCFSIFWAKKRDLPTKNSTLGREITVEITLETVENEWRHREKPPRILQERVDSLGQEVRKKEITSYGLNNTNNT